MKGSLPAARQAQTINAVVATLSCCLDLDTGALICELRQAEEARHNSTPGVDDHAVGEVLVEEMEDEEEAPRYRRNGKADNDFSDLLPVSMSVLVLLCIHASACCPLSVLHSTETQ